MLVLKEEVTAEARGSIWRVVHCMLEVWLDCEQVRNSFETRIEHLQMQWENQTSCVHVERCEISRPYMIDDPRSEQGETSRQV